MRRRKVRKGNRRIIKDLRQRRNRKWMNLSMRSPTFARRARPESVEGAQRWDSLKRTFNARVASLFAHPSSMEVWGP